jgi:hypothetical protein
MRIKDGWFIDMYCFFCVVIRNDDIMIKASDRRIRSKRNRIMHLLDINVLDRKEAMKMKKSLLNGLIDITLI